MNSEEGWGKYKPLKLWILGKRQVQDLQEWVAPSGGQFWNKHALWEYWHKLER